jgi:hypothetical protein
MGSCWFYHFRNGGYKVIRWVEIAIDTGKQRAAVLAELVRMHVPGEQTESGYRDFGYLKTGGDSGLYRRMNILATAALGCGFNRWSQHSNPSAFSMRSVAMKQRPRIYYTDS